MEDTINSVLSGKASVLQDYAQSEKFSDWTIVEREKLLTGLKKYGPLDVSKLQKIVGSRSVQEILVFLKDMRVRAETELDKSKIVMSPPSVELWLEIVDFLLDLHPDYSSELERVLIKFAFRLKEDVIENRYTYTMANGDMVDVEYSRILLHLACLVKGCAVNKLTTLESFIVLQMLQRLIEFVKNLDLTSVCDYLIKISDAYKNQQLAQPADDLPDDLENGDHIGETVFDKSFNPLTVPPEIIEPNLLTGEALTLDFEPVLCVPDNLDESFEDCTSVSIT